MTRRGKFYQHVAQRVSITSARENQEYSEPDKSCQVQSRFRVNKTCDGEEMSMVMAVDVFIQRLFFTDVPERSVESPVREQDINLCWDLASSESETRLDVHIQSVEMILRQNREQSIQDVRGVWGFRVRFCVHSWANMLQTCCTNKPDEKQQYPGSVFALTLYTQAAS